jgi:hypothetical protein
MVDATGLEPVVGILESLARSVGSKNSKQENAPRHAPKFRRYKNPWNLREIAEYVGEDGIDSQPRKSI